VSFGQEARHAERLSQGGHLLASLHRARAVLSGSAEGRVGTGGNGATIGGAAVHLCQDACSIWLRLGRPEGGFLAGADMIAVGGERGLSSESVARMDVLEIDGASNNGVGAGGELARNVRYFFRRSGEVQDSTSSTRCTCSRGAFKRAARTLEEPPAAREVMFATDRSGEGSGDDSPPLRRTFDLRRIPTLQLTSNILARLRRKERCDDRSSGGVCLARVLTRYARTPNHAGPAHQVSAATRLKSRTFLSMFDSPRKGKFLNLSHACWRAKFTPRCISSMISRRKAKIGRLLFRSAQPFGI